MRYEEFVAKYPREHDVPWYADAERQGITAEAAEWSHKLGVYLHDYLSGGDATLSAHSAAVELAEYSRWNTTHFVPTVRAIERVAGGNHGVRSMHFHTLAHCLWQSWRPIFPAGPMPTVVDLRQSQLLLSLHAAGMMVQRHINLGGEARATDLPGSTTFDLQSGMLTETDTALVLLEIARGTRGLVVLPAPPQFESGAPGRNVDLLVLDTKARTIVGVQVKAHVATTAKRKQYASDGLVLVDGRVDLGNEMLTRVRSLSSTRQLTAWPGLISAHHLLEIGWRNPIYTRWHPRIEELQPQIEPTVFGTTNYRRRAVAQLRARIVSSLVATAA